MDEGVRKGGGELPIQAAVIVVHILLSQEQRSLPVIVWSAAVDGSPVPETPQSQDAM